MHSLADTQVLSSTMSSKKCNNPTAIGDGNTYFDSAGTEAWREPQSRLESAYQMVKDESVKAEEVGYQSWLRLSSDVEYVSKAVCESADECPCRKAMHTLRSLRDDPDICATSTEKETGISPHSVQDIRGSIVNDIDKKRMAHRERWEKDQKLQEQSQQVNQAFCET